MVVTSLQRNPDLTATFIDSSPYLEKPSKAWYGIFVEWKPYCRRFKLENIYIKVEFLHFPAIRKITWLRVTCFVVVFSKGDCIESMVLEDREGANSKINQKF